MWFPLLVILAGVCASAVDSLEVCAPDCTNKVPGDMVVDPKDCTQFYYCLANQMPNEYPIPCEEGHVFDTATGSCVPGTECTNLCSSKECNYVCNDNLKVVSDPLDCGQYYLCSPSGAVGPLQCPDNRPFFNGEACINKYECCSDPCTPYCVAAGSQIPDPKNCSMFYVCLEDGPPSEDLHFSCPDGANFDVTVGFCFEGAQCQFLCLDPPSTTEATTAMTTTQTTTPLQCLDSFVCTEVGSFQKFPTCVPEYYACYAEGVCAVPEKCKEGMVFNPVPEYPYCIVPEMCPHTPV
ncbi:peritrophin-44-like [Penaeus chinensis]|uniref:peritrophin-44-like n=1 Tax=Penaeus chinensis TaxID=139456 RepID=UPI001FB6925F|nr:peritrophin-44-like [Penaeus chinensis]